jgi:hypothetical protein
VVNLALRSDCEEKKEKERRNKKEAFPGSVDPAARKRSKKGF